MLLVARMCGTSLLRVIIERRLLKRTPDIMVVTTPRGRNKVAPLVRAMKRRRRNPTHGGHFALGLTRADRSTALVRDARLFLSKVASRAVRAGLFIFGNKCRGESGGNVEEPGRMSEVSEVASFAVLLACLTY